VASIYTTARRATADEFVHFCLVRAVHQTAKDIRGKKGLKKGSKKRLKNNFGSKKNKNDEDEEFHQFFLTEFENKNLNEFDEDVDCTSDSCSNTSTDGDDKDNKHYSPRQTLKNQPKFVYR
jgi:hypothetical protein